MDLISKEGIIKQIEESFDTPEWKAHFAWYENLSIQGKREFGAAMKEAAEEWIKEHPVND